MPLIRTDKGFQWTSDVEAVTLKRDSIAARTVPVFAEASASAPAKNLLSGSKEFLPWILAGFQIVSWFGVKYLTSDRMQQQQIDDHVALVDMRSQMGKLELTQSALGSKLDLLISFNLNKK